MNEKSPHNSIFSNSWKLPIAILLLAAILRLWGTFELNFQIEDEFLHTSTALSLGTYGTTTDWGWPHPQLSSVIMFGTIRLLGNNPAGWRSSNVFFGTASVALIFLIGRLLYPGTAVPLMAMALLAFDPHHIYLSRATFVEIPVTFFFLLFLYFLLQYTENRRPTLPLAGIAMGLTMATKAYFVLAMPTAIMYTLYRTRQRGELPRPVMVDLGVTLLLLPVAVYFLSYFWWFARGYTLPEFVQMKMDSVRSLTHMLEFEGQPYLLAGGKPWEWFTRPMVWGHQLSLDGAEGRFLIQTNNPPFRMLVLPSILIVSFYAVHRRSAPDLLAPILFAACYLLILLARRPMFSYSVAGMLPFAYLALARTVSLGALKMRRERLVYACFLCCTLIWGVYMFPLVSARWVPLTPFRPILALAGYMGTF